jgi:uncharacterized protein YcbX
VREVQIIGARFRLDREWGIYDLSKNSVIANHNTLDLIPFTLEFDDADTLIISHSDAQEDLVIDIGDHPQDRNNSRHFVLYGDKEGYSEGKEASDWLSQILKREVHLVRSRYDAEYKAAKKTVPYMREEDRSVGFMYNSSMLILNEASFHDLVNVMRSQYEKAKETEELKKIHVKMENFRGNIIIDEEVPYEEDRYRALEIRTRENRSPSGSVISNHHHLEEESRRSDHQHH